MTNGAGFWKYAEVSCLRGRLSFLFSQNAMSNLASITCRQFVLVAVCLCLTCGVWAQPAVNTNAPTNPDVQPSQVQPVPPVQPIPLPETTNTYTNNYINAPELTNELSTETGLTNPPLATTTPPPLLGPRTGGGDQLAPPIMGTSVPRNQNQPTKNGRWRRKTSAKIETAMSAAAEAMDAAMLMDAPGCG